MVPMYMFLFILVMLVAVFQLYIYRSVKTFVEDALAASNLASAVVDIREYGISHNIIISDPADAYELYQDALKINMNLDNQWNYTDQTIISGEVEILDYIVYNVRETDVEISYFGQNQYQETVADGLGNVTAPNGMTIESTSVYSRITFPVEGIFGIHAVAEKDKLVDIVN